MTGSSTPSRLQFHLQMLAQLGERAQHLRVAQSDALMALQNARQVYEGITDDLNDVEGQLRSIRETVQNLEKKLSARVMQAFPDELLRLIFSELAADLHIQLEWDTPSDDWPQCLAHLPFYLSAVCRRWRRVALDVSSLWSMITLQLVTADEAARILTGLTLMLERSKKAPLDIFMDWQSLEWSNVAGSPVSQINTAIQQCSVRWRRYVLIIPTSLSDASFFDKFRYPTDILEEFSVQSMSGYRMQGCPLYLAHCPQLKKLHTDNCHIVRTPLFAGQPPLEILVLTCRLSSAIVWQILGLSSGLIRFELSVSSDEELEITAPPSPLVLPRLQHLECSTWAIEYLQMWIDHLQTPVLSTIALHETEAGIPDAILPRFKNSLTSLVYDVDDELNEHNAEAIAELINLKHLTIYAFCSARFLLYLAEHGSLPMLETLSFPSTLNFQHNSNSGAITIAEALVEFVRQRNVVQVQDSGGDHPPVRPVTLQRIIFDLPGVVPHWVDAQLLHLLPQATSSA